MLEMKLELPDIPSGPGQRKWFYNFVRQLRMLLKDATPVDSGEAKASWTIVRRDETGYSFGNPAPYAHVLEHGSVKGQKPWPQVGPRTVEIGGQIYSSQAPGGILATAGAQDFIDKSFKDFMDKFK